MRGDVHALKAPRGAKGHERQGRRFAVILQSDDLLLSTVLVAPTSPSAQGSSFRPEIEVQGRRTLVLVEQARAVDRSRLGAVVDRLSLADMQDVDRALKVVLGLR